MKKNTLTDGYNPELVAGAFFAGKLEFPVSKPVTIKTYPEILIPVSKIDKSINCNKEFVHFYEKDKEFIGFINDIKENYKKLSKFAGIISSDCSVYWDSPLAVQIANIYRNHQTAYYLQTVCNNVVPNIRWGDERTYTDSIIPGEIFAFIGYPKHSVVAIGNYGCYQTKEEKHHFNEGLKAMIRELMPTDVIVYGSTKNKVFQELTKFTRFHEYNDWITIMKGAKHGHK